MSTFTDYLPFILLFLLAHGAFIVLLCKSCRARGYNAGREDERQLSAGKVLNAKKEGAMAERQRLFSPSNISKT